MSSSYPLISIIMNCHNGSKFLNESLNSVFSQSFKNWELIFFDNFSSDNSKEILLNYNDKRIKYFRSHEKVELYKARNLAIKKCQGDYVCFLDTDDLWSIDKLEKQLEFFKINDKIKILYTNYFIIEKNQKKIKYESSLPKGRIPQKLLDNYCIGIVTVMIKKDIFDTLKFDENYNIIGDFDFFFRLSLKNEIGVIQKPLAYYRVHENNLSKKLDIYLSEMHNWLKNNKKNLLNSKLSLRGQQILYLKLKIKLFFKKYLLYDL